MPIEATSNAPRNRSSATASSLVSTSTQMLEGFVEPRADPGLGLLPFGDVGEQVDRLAETPALAEDPRGRHQGPEAAPIPATEADIDHVLPPFHRSNSEATAVWSSSKR